MLRDNYAEYLRRETRGTPRNGAALLQGIGAVNLMNDGRGTTLKRWASHAAGTPATSRHVGKASSRAVRFDGRKAVTAKLKVIVDRPCVE